jgi:hypothetical protein
VPPPVTTATLAIEPMLTSSKSFSPRG